MKENKFNTWRRRKRVTLEVFCNKTGIKHSTAAKWTLIGSPAMPHDAHADMVRKVYPDCPLV